VKSLGRHMEEAGISVPQLAAMTGLNAKVVAAIAGGNYTPGPLERERLAAALGVSKDDISWGHAVSVQYLRGNGPQTGRAT
jgi:ribosome-binding protein aMBF1 (putative translation factor)